MFETQISLNNCIHFFCSGNRPLHEKGCGRSGKVSRHLAKGSQCIEHQSERKVRRGSEEGDQETPAVTRPNQDVDRFPRYQGQIGPHGETKAYRDGKNIITNAQRDPPLTLSPNKL